MDTNIWTDELLDRMRKVGDPLADTAIAEIYQSGQEEHVRKALTGWGGNSDTLPEGLPPALQRFFEQSSVLPEWSDAELIDRGQRLLGRYTPQITSTLLCASLPLCYGCGNGAQVLHRSQRLTEGVYRRLMETSQFVVDVLDTGSLGPTGRGVRSAQKIRLLHATMRHHLSRQDDWDTRWGAPINQEDLAGTLMSFSVVIPRGLARLGIDLPAADRDAFFHIWRVIGHILGVSAEVNPDDFAGGSELFDAILRRQQSPTRAGTTLTKGILDFMREILPGPAFAGVGPSLIRHLAGDEAADIVEVPPADHTRIALALSSPLNTGWGKTNDTVPVMAEAANHLGLAIFEQGLRLTNKGRRYDWEVPTGLTERD
jgi:hypothetical protein